ncbi:MAG: hypothetical protein VW840_09740 [Gammaproteobacteria bacterium]
MVLAVININDAGIQVGLDGDLTRTSPGYAVLNNDQLMVGEVAARNARLLPRWTSNRFWSQLSTAPMESGTAQVRHHADLAFAHLEDLWQPISAEATDAILIVPGYFSTEQLGLLLGMARECQIPVRGIVDHSVVAASNLPLRQNVLHLDIHLHSMTLSNLSNTGTLARRSAKTIVETGLATLWDRWADIIANQFIQTTRYDPMHEAASEQRLFDQLPGWIAGLGDETTHTFELEIGGNAHSVAVSHDNLLRACASLYPQIVQAIRAEIPAGENASLLLSHRLQGFPGLQDSLRLIPEISCIELAEMKGIGSASLNRDQIMSSDGAISHVTQLQAGDIASDDSVKERTATHLLWRHHATPIGTQFKLDASLDNGPKRSDNPVATFYTSAGQLLMDCHEPEQLQLNGQQPEASTKLQPGDVLQLQNETLTLVSVGSHG